MANLGPDVIYKNDSPTGYFALLGNTAASGDFSIIDAGRIPTQDPSVPGVNRDNYTVNGFRFGYCTDIAGPNVNVTFNLYDSYAPCDTIVTAPISPFHLAGNVVATGLPGGGGIGACWTVTLDFAGGQEFCLVGDGGPANPGLDADVNLDSFGIEFTFNGIAGTQTGPLLSGDPTWNLNISGSFTGTGGGGTYYEPVGSFCGYDTGLDTQDLLVVDGLNASLLPGCYFFGGYNNFTGCATVQNVPYASVDFTIFAETGAGNCDPNPMLTYVNEQVQLTLLTGSAGDALPIGTVDVANIDAWRQMIVDEWHYPNATTTGSTAFVDGFFRVADQIGLDPVLYQQHLDILTFGPSPLLPGDIVYQVYWFMTDSNGLPYNFSTLSYADPLGVPKFEPLVGAAPKTVSNNTINITLNTAIADVEFSAEATFGDGGTGEATLSLLCNDDGTVATHTATCNTTSGFLWEVECTHTPVANFIFNGHDCCKTTFHFAYAVGFKSLTVGMNGVTLTVTGNLGWGGTAEQEVIKCCPLPGNIGTRYGNPSVPNSSGMSAEIEAKGSDFAVDNDVELLASSMPANQFGYFLNSQTQGLFANPGGSQGNLLLGGSIGRFSSQVQSTGPMGDFGIQVNLSQVPTPTGPTAVMSGQTWNFTAWFRDANPTPTSNFTDGVSIQFQ